jgi:hypothetical protein
MSDEQKHTLISPTHLKLRIELDRDEVFPDDPGNGTPAMVYVTDKQGKQCSGTFWCANDTGEVDYVELSEAQLTWLRDQEDEVYEFLYGAEPEEEED